MSATPGQYLIDIAIAEAALSPCRSKRGVVIFDPSDAFRGVGHNGPPGDQCPGREVCAGKCGRLSVHAEVRALMEAAAWDSEYGQGEQYDLLHVELAADGTVVACDGPSCIGCAVQILDAVLDAGFIGGVWLYLGLSRCLGCRRFEDSSDKATDRYKRCPECGAHLTQQGAWRRYTAEEFHDSTLRNCGIRP